MKRAITNAVHLGAPQVREQAANFLLSICSDFDDNNSLLEIQKIGKNPDEELVINFISEKNKSKKQLTKLLSVVTKHIGSRADYQALIKSSNPQDVVLPEPNSQSNIQEEKALILAGVFGKKTSVIFDI